MQYSAADKIVALRCGREIFVRHADMKNKFHNNIPHFCSDVYD